MANKANKKRPGGANRKPGSPQQRGSDAARAKSAERREQMRKQERNRKLGFIGLGTTLVVVLAVVITLVAVQRAGHKNDTKNVNASAPKTLLSNLENIPAATFASVGTEGLNKTVLGLKPISGTPDLTNGKPTLIYAGGEFCPICAAERWVLTTTLNRFGSFTGLQTSRSAADDGNFATLTFLHAKYTSKYVAFDGKEIYDRAKNPLQTLSKAASASYSKFGTPGSVPYYTVNNAYVGQSAQFNSEELGTLTSAQIAAQIHAGKTQLAKDVLFASNILTAAICTQTGNKPGSVCTAPEVVAAGKVGLGASSSGTGSSVSNSN